jgi:hypothetical protein
VPETFIFNAPSGQETCDFCYAAPAARFYTGRNFRVPRTKSTVFRRGSIGTWAACKQCAESIDTSHWSDLTDRAVRCFVKRHHVSPADEQEVREQLRQIHLLFRDHMIKEV